MTARQAEVFDERAERWIATATRGLAKDPARRLREEILDHVAEAVDAALSDGADPATPSPPPPPRTTRSLPTTRNADHHDRPVPGRLRE